MCRRIMAENAVFDEYIAMWGTDVNQSVDGLFADWLGAIVATRVERATSAHI